MHSVDGDHRRKYLTLQGIEVCTTAWYLIHGIPKSTFHSYVQRYNEWILSTAYGNKDCKRPRIGTVQVMGTIAAIVKENVDQMSHQMQGIEHGRVNTLKEAVGNNWKRMMADANEVRVTASQISCIRRSLDGNHSFINSHFSLLHCRCSEPTSRNIQLWFVVICCVIRWDCSFAFVTFVASSLTGLLAPLQTNVSLGLPTVSQSTISRIRKDHFNNIAIKPVGSSFAKCSTCDQLQEFILKSPKGSPEYVEFVKQWEEHLAHQQSCPCLYGAWREESRHNPNEILCIIYDKMDIAKNALPRMRVTTKATQGLGQLPMNVTNMVSQWHGDGAYAHYSLHCWPGDSNATISSLARLFHWLEGPSIQESRALF